MVRASVAIAVLAALAGCKGTEPAPEPDQARVIEQTVTEAVEAGFERNEVDAYLAIWTDDATIVGSRGETDDPHQVTFDRATLEAVRRMTASMPWRDMQVRFEDVKVSVNGDEAELRCRTVITAGPSEESVRELYRLRRTSGGWKVAHNRYWPERTVYEKESHTYDAARWKELDAEVEEARSSGDRARLTSALLTAWRFDQAVAEARVLAKEAPEDAYAQHLAANVLRLGGHPKEALPVYRRIAKRWPDAPVPAVAKE
jgi:ketosteroid isomerase-like protein